MRRAAVRGVCVTAIALVLAAATVPARAQAVNIIEFYNTLLDHYFVSSLQPDIVALDSGHFFGCSPIK
jgi:hypothetical protein